MASKLYKLLIEILKNHDCYFIREGKGSHEFWGSAINGAKFSVPVTVASRHTANAILKQAGIDEKI